MEQASIKNLIQSNTNFTQSGNKLLENKIDNLQTVTVNEIKRVERINEVHAMDIEELKGLGNRIKGSLGVLNWIGIGTFGMALLALIKVFFSSVKP